MKRIYVIHPRRSLEDLETYKATMRAKRDERLAELKEQPESVERDSEIARLEFAEFMGNQEADQ